MRGSLVYPLSCKGSSASLPPPHPHPTNCSCPALSGDARAEDVKLILGYAISRIADSSSSSPPLLIRSAFFSPLRSQLQLLCN